jgi:hypothetical protein
MAPGAPQSGPADAEAHARQEAQRHRDLGRRSSRRSPQGE